MKRRREASTSPAPRVRARLDVFPFLDLFSDVRGEVYGWLDPLSAIRMSRVNRQLHEETRAYQKVLPVQWHTVWTASIGPLRDSLRGALVELVTAGIATSPGVTSVAHLQIKSEKIIWRWLDGGEAWELRWRFDNTGWRVQHFRMAPAAVVVYRVMHLHHYAPIGPMLLEFIQRERTLKEGPTHGDRDPVGV